MDGAKRYNIEDVRWDVLNKIRCSHKWTWADVARRMGISEAHLSEYRHGNRSTTWPLIKMLVYVFQVSYNDMLKHPYCEMQMTARTALKLSQLEDGRPWPTAYAKPEHDFRTHYQRHVRMQRRTNRLPNTPEKNN